MVRRIAIRDKVITGGDINGHVRTSHNWFDSVYGGGLGEEMK